MITEVEEREWNKPGYLTRLQDYDEEGLSSELQAFICPSGCNDDCEDCPNLVIREQLEYNIQTEMIKLGKYLVAQWAASSIEH